MMRSLRIELFSKIQDIGLQIRNYSLNPEVPSYYNITSVSVFFPGTTLQEKEIGER